MYALRNRYVAKQQSAGTSESIAPIQNSHYSRFQELLAIFVNAIRIMVIMFPRLS